jgi:hypothetical protein
VFFLCCHGGDVNSIWQMEAAHRESSINRLESKTRQKEALEIINFVRPILEQSKYVSDLKIACFFQQPVVG